MNSMLRVILNPKCWIRSYSTDETVDRFVQTILDHKDEIEWVKCDNFYTFIKFRGNIYGLWDADGWFSYLSHIVLIKDIEKPYITEKQCDKKMPSRETCFRFYDEIGWMVEKSRKTNDKLFLEDAIRECQETKEEEK